MRWVLPALGCCLALATLGGCSHAPASAQAAVDSPAGVENGLYRGFDRNDYPGAETMAGLHKTFAFTGYWLNNPPGEETNTWALQRPARHPDSQSAEARRDRNRARRQRRGRGRGSRAA
jgi:hypothetical protein